MTTKDITVGAIYTLETMRKEENQIGKYLTSVSKDFFEMENTAGQMDDDIDQYETDEESSDG